MAENTSSVNVNLDNGYSAGTQKKTTTEEAAALRQSRLDEYRREEDSTVTQRLMNPTAGSQSADYYLARAQAQLDRFDNAISAASNNIVA